MRFTLVLALALQLFGSLAPANAFVICLSNDGCVELEPAAPGASRCAENNCDETHAGNSSHSCRDIPLLIDAGAPSRGPVVDHAPLLPALMAVPYLDLPTVASPPRSRTVVPNSVTPPRTVVLQL